MPERLGDQRVDARAAGVSVLAGDRAAILYHHVDAWWAEGVAKITLSCEGAARAIRFSRLGSSHAKWVELGGPDDPSPEQVAQLREASGLKELRTVPTEGGRLIHQINVPVHEAILCEVVV